MTIRARQLARTVSFFLLPAVLTHASAQTFNISGTVTVSNSPVRNALLTFIGSVDTTVKVSTTTDTLGQYHIGLLSSSVKEEGNLPANFHLAQNYPNPFMGSTAIPYNLGTQSDVRVTIYDILGREVKSFRVGTQAAGTHSVTWDGRNNLNKTVTTGVYFYRLEAKGGTQVRKMIYGTGDKNGVVALPNNISIPGSSTPHIAAFPSQAVTFSVRIANTDSTFPPVVPTQSANLTVDRDTTFNFTVAQYVDPYLMSVLIDSSRQIIRGFGAANILAWRPDMTSDEITRAFGTGPGQIGFSILRLRLPSTQAEFSQNLPTAQAAKAMGVTLFASPWSPPATMKSNNNIVGGYLSDASYASFAAWLKSFADYMGANGAPLSAVSVQNEPDASVSYESCSWNATQLLRFARDFAPAVGYPIIIPESMNFNRTLSDPILNDPVAVNNVSIIGGHLYGGGLASYPLATSRGKDVWMTEWLDTDTSWAHTIAVAKQINDCMIADMNAYVWWYIVRFYGPILEDGSVSKRGYTMSQYARFIRPGYYRVMTTGRPQNNVDITAYTHGSKVVIVLVNRNAASVKQTLSIPNGTMSSFTPYVTSASKNCVQLNDISFMNARVTVTLDASSVVTLVGG